MYTIELADGTKLEGLELNGNNFITDTPLNPAMFPEAKLLHVKITADDLKTDDDEELAVSDMVGEFEHMKLIYAGDGGLLAPGKFRLILGEYTPSELEAIRRESNIQYLSMMTGVEL